MNFKHNKIALFIGIVAVGLLLLNFQTSTRTAPPRSQTQPKTVGSHQSHPGDD